MASGLIGFGSCSDMGNIDTLSPTVLFHLKVRKLLHLDKVETKYGTSDRSKIIPHLNHYTSANVLANLLL